MTTILISLLNQSFKSKNSKLKKILILNISITHLKPNNHPLHDNHKKISTKTTNNDMIIIQTHTKN